MNETSWKKMAVCAAAVCLSLSAGAQMKDFEKFAHMKGVEYVHVDKGMVEQAAQKGESIRHGDYVVIGDDSGEILRQVDDVKVFSCKAGKAAEKLKKEVLALLKKENFQSLIDVNDEGNKVKICQSHEGGKTQNIVFIEDEEDQEMLLILIDGTFDIAKLMEQQAEED